jgi:ADP-ribose pyrophosphatase
MNIVSSVEKYKSPIFTVTHDHAVEPGGFQIERDIIQHPGSAVMMAVEEHGRILLVKQFRLPAKQFLWELPAGKIDPGESAFDAAKRELIEETGYRALHWHQLQSFYPSPGFLAEKMTIYLATGLTEGEATPMGDERIERQWFTSAEVLAMIDTGEVADAKTIIGYYRGQAYLAASAPGITAPA